MFSALELCICLCPIEFRLHTIRIKDASSSTRKIVEERQSDCSSSKRAAHLAATLSICAVHANSIKKAAGAAFCLLSGQRGSFRQWLVFLFSYCNIMFAVIFSIDCRYRTKLSPRRNVVHLCWHARQVDGLTLH